MVGLAVLAGVGLSSAHDLSLSGNGSSLLSMVVHNQNSDTAIAVAPVEVTRTQTQVAPLLAVPQVQAPVAPVEMAAIDANGVSQFAPLSSPKPVARPTGQEVAVAAMPTLATPGAAAPVMMTKSQPATAPVAYPYPAPATGADGTQIQPLWLMGVFR